MMEYLYPTSLMLNIGMALVLIRTLKVNEKHVDDYNHLLATCRCVIEGSATARLDDEGDVVFTFVN